MRRSKPGINVRVRLVAVGAAAGLVAGGLALNASTPTNSPTFRDAAYGVTYKHHIKLTGVVVGKTTIRQEHKLSPASVISIKRGKKTVGKWVLGPTSSIGFNGHSEGTEGGGGTMKVGSIRGKVTISVRCLSNFHGLTAYTGSLYAGAKSEGLTFKGCPPGGGTRKKGTKFAFTLSY